MRDKSLKLSNGESGARDGVISESQLTDGGRREKRDAKYSRLAQDGNEIKKKRNYFSHEQFDTRRYDD